MCPLFGFAQLDLAGTLPLADGRYLARSGSGEESVLVVATLSATPLARRRRRRAREADPAPPQLALTRATSVRAWQPFAAEEAAVSWLDTARESEGAADAVLAQGVALLNRALAAHALAAADPAVAPLAVERAAAARIGYGSGEEVAASEWTRAVEIDIAAAGSRRQRRSDDLRPAERVAALLRGTEAPALCEAPLLRARTDLEGGRDRDAALQLRIAVDALLAELPDALDDDGHARDVEDLRKRSPQLAAIEDRALDGALDAAEAEALATALAVAERVVRRIRVLRS